MDFKFLMLDKTSIILLLGPISNNLDRFNLIYKVREKSPLQNEIT